MGPRGVELLRPSFDHHLGLPERVEYVSVKQYITELAIEAFVIAILLGVGRFNVESLNPHVAYATVYHHGCEPPQLFDPIHIGLLCLSQNSISLANIWTPK